MNKLPNIGPPSHPAKLQRLQNRPFDPFLPLCVNPYVLSGYVRPVLADKLAQNHRFFRRWSFAVGFLF